MKFRLLEAGEIECRVATVKDKGCSLLLYKDARCDMNILDETVGLFGWKREHTRDNANCIVSIWDKEKQQWISKEDTGTESRADGEGNEKKGLASDSFKRACFNWGIGRELYTAPFIWIRSTDCTIYEKNGKKTCSDLFEVSSISYKNGKIIELEIVNKKLNRVVFRMGKPERVTNQDLSKELATNIEKKTFIELCEKKGVDAKEIAKQAGVIPGEKMTAEQHGRALIILKEMN